MNFRKVHLNDINCVNTLAILCGVLYQKARLKAINCVNVVLTHLVCYPLLNCVNTLDKKRLYDTLNCVKTKNNCVNTLTKSKCVKSYPPLYI